MDGDWDENLEQQEHDERHARIAELKRLREVNAELLAACKRMRATMYSPKSEESIMADAAIAKAESV